MKLFLVLLLTLCANRLIAQTANGTVLDAVTRIPISNAQIITANNTILTDTFGKFKLNNIKAGDKFAIRIMGYETSEIVFDGKIDTMRINLKQTAIVLTEVMIKTARNYKLDSLRLRKEYAAVFAYKAPGFKDMFVNVDPSYRPPLALVRPNSTASILKFNALSAFSIFGKKNKSTTKFKSILAKGEELNYVDNIFSKEKIADITKLTGKQLIDFMNTYRPSILTIRRMTGYELNIYISKCFLEFEQSKIK